MSEANKTNKKIMKKGTLSSLIMLMKPMKNRFRVKIVLKFLKLIKQTKRLLIWKSEMKQADRKKNIVLKIPNPIQSK